MQAAGSSLPAPVGQAAAAVGGAASSAGQKVLSAAGLKPAGTPGHGKKGELIIPFLIIVVFIIVFMDEVLILICTNYFDQSPWKLRLLGSAKEVLGMAGSITTNGSPTSLSR